MSVLIICHCVCVCACVSLVLSQPLHRYCMTFQSVSANQLMSGLTFEDHFAARAKDFSTAQKMLQFLQTQPEILPGVTLVDLIGEPTGQSVVCRGTFAPVGGAQAQTRPVAVEVPVAVKIFLKITSAATSEIALLKRCNHPNIITLLSDIDVRGIKVLVLPLASHSLSSVGLVNSPLDIVRYTLQVARALEYLHGAMGMSHLDVKAANVLVFPDGTVQLIDFGLSCPYDPLVPRTIYDCGTPGFMSPETLHKVLGQPRASGDLSKVDMYAFGCLFWELMAGQPPYRREADEAGWSEARAKLVDRHSPGDMLDPRWLRDGRRFICVLMKRCCAFDPTARPRASEVVFAFRMLDEGVV